MVAYVVTKLFIIHLVYTLFFSCITKQTDYERFKVLVINITRKSREKLLITMTPVSMYLYVFMNKIVGISVGICVSVSF